MILSLGACRLYGEPTRIFKVCGLRREWNGPRSGERSGERGEDAHVGIERNELKHSHAERPGLAPRDPAGEPPRRFGLSSTPERSHFAATAPTSIVPATHP